MIKTADKAACLFFVDIVGSGTLYSHVDHDQALARIAELKSLLRETILRYNGKIEGEVAQEFMCHFAQPQEAMNAAHEMQVMVAERSSGDSGDQYLGIRIGMHHGEINFSPDADKQTDTLFVAKRMVNHAEHNEVLTTLATRELVSKQRRYKFKIRHPEVKESPEDTLSMQELLWEDIVEPHVLIEINDDENIKLKSSAGKWLVGRGEHCDISIPLPGLSREHLQIAYTNGWLEMTDQSTNGTLIYPHGAKEILLKGRKARIRGKGKLQFTPPGYAGQEVSFQYSIVDDE